MARIGILGGSFNPPHLAHLVCASEAAAQLDLDRVLLTPVATAPHKDPDQDPGPEVRLELCRLAIDGDERLGICDLEVRGADRRTRSIRCVSYMRARRRTT